AQAAGRDRVRRTRPPQGRLEAAGAPLRARRHGQIRQHRLVRLAGRRHHLNHLIIHATSTGTLMKKLTGAEIVWECLQKEGVDVVFGYPGGAILPTYDAMTKYPKIHHVLVRHEQGATHMADGYARASGKVGVAIATSGPGATNMVTGISTAMMDSSPIVCITGQVV